MGTARGGNQCREWRYWQTVVSSFWGVMYCYLTVDFTPLFFKIMIYIKYKDPKANNDNTFSSAKDLEKFKSGEIEAVGYLLQEDETSLYIAMQKNGDKFRKVLFVPKATVLERSEEPRADVMAVVYTDVQLAFPTANATLEKLNALGKPSDVVVTGFIVRDTDEDILLAMERNADGNFRTYTVLPKIHDKKVKK